MASRRPERDLSSRAIQELKELGYIFVESEVAIGVTRSRARADVLAWATNEQGEFGPAVLVEIKSSFSGSEERRVLAQLAALSNTFGTDRNYLYDGTWRLASPHFDRLYEVEYPEAASSSDMASSVDVSVFQRLLVHRLWSAADSARSRAASPEMAISVMRQVSQDDDENLQWLWNRFGDQAAEPLLSFVSRMSGKGTELVPQSLAQAMARILDPEDNSDVLDPFCGLGSLLWACKAYGDDHGRSLHLRGIDVNQGSVLVASEMAELTRSERISFEVGEWSLDQVEGAGHVISAPPMGIRLKEPRLLPGGQETTDGDAYNLHRIGASIPNGARAVVLVARSLLSRRSAGPVREWLSNNLRIVAIVGLPAGALSTTGVASALVVLEHSSPTETLIANLQDDWSEQLAPEGEFFQNYVVRLRRS